MTNEQLSASLSYLGDELLAECGARRQRPKRSWRTALIKAACIALVLFSGIYVAGRFDYSLGAGCASSPGTIADGRYYYHVRHSGVWCYDPAMGTSERVLSTFWYDGYAVNGYGIYYLRGETLYVQVHETGERIKLYTAPQDRGFSSRCSATGASTSGSASTAIPFIRTKSQPTQSPMYRPGAIMTPSSGANTCSTAGPASCWRSGRSTHPPVRASSSSMKTRTSRSAGTNLPSCRAVSGRTGSPSTGFSATART